MPTDDPYDILGVERDASASEIKRAYRRLAMRHHPDRNPDGEGSAEAFKRISWAYQLLSDPERRRRYDRRGLSGLERPISPGDFNLERAMEAFTDALELFASLFSGPSQTRPPAVRGDDLEATVSVSFADVLEGPRRTIEAPGVRCCRACQGSGAAEGATAEPCSRCDGDGTVRPSFFGRRTRCERCGGRGEIPSEACRKCGGSGRESFVREVGIEIPRGVREGEILRRSGDGAPGRFGGSAGDLLVEVSVEPHEEFERDRDDVRSSTAISHTTAALGGTVRLPTLEGDVVLTIPAGTSAGDTFRLGGLGFPNPRTDRRGDHYVDVSIKTPVDLTERQRERVEMRRSKSPDAGPSIGDRIRSFLPGIG